MVRTLLSYEVINDEMGTGVTVATTWGVGVDNYQVQVANGAPVGVSYQVLEQETEYLRFKTFEEARGMLDYYERLTSVE